MAETAIKIENIGKRYIIKHSGAPKVDGNLNKIAAAARRIGKPLRRSKKEEFWALKDINLDIMQGESIGIIGKNGAGKSTLLKLLSRITEPTQGRIEINGTVSAMLEVGTGFNRELTGRENIYLNGAILGMSRAEVNSKLDTIIEFSEVEKFIDTPVKRYSSGMFVRLAFAVASHLEPDIMVVDEVLAVGDSRFQKKCLDQMAHVASNGRTVLYVSHNMATIRQLCSKVVFLNSGRIGFVGDVEEGIAHYFAEGGANELVRDLSGYKRGNWISQEVIMTKIEMLDTVDCVYEYGDEIKFRLHVHASSDVKDMTVRFEARGAGNEHIGMSFSEPVGNLTAGRDYVLEMCVSDHRLAPNSYTAAVSLCTGNNFAGYSTLDTTCPTFTFDVRGIITPDGLRETWSKTWGNVHLPPARALYFGEE